MSYNKETDLSNDNNIFAITLKKGFLQNTYKYHINQQKSIERSQKRKSIIQEKYKNKYDTQVKNELKYNNNIVEAKNKIKNKMKKEKENYQKFIGFKRNRELLDSMSKDLFEVWEQYKNIDHLSISDKFKVEFNYLDVVLSLDYYITNFQKKYDSYNTIQILHKKMEFM